MATQRADEYSGHADNLVDVRMTLAGDGGWDVIATLGGHILAIQHCTDWHRAERAYLRMSGDTRLHGVEAA
jgi:hypothetical protein